jgi:hypothetical protein
VRAEFEPELREQEFEMRIETYVLRRLIARWLRVCWVSSLVRL